MTARSSLDEVGWLLSLLLLLACGSASSSSGSDSAGASSSGASSSGAASSGAASDGASGSFQPLPTDAAPAAVVSAAEADLPFWLGLVGGQWASLGFQSSQEPGVAELGAPHAVYWFSSLSHPGTSDLAMPYAWRFPVVANGAFRCMLTVASQDGRWQVVSLGGLGASLQAAETSHASLASGSWAVVELDHWYEFLATGLAQARPSFVPLPPATELVTQLPKYRAWTAADEVPVLSFEELSAIAALLPPPGSSGGGP